MDEKNKKSGGLIANIAAIVIILIVVFLSQQPYFRSFGKSLHYQSTQKLSSYWAKATNWFRVSIYPKVSGEVAVRGKTLKEEVGKQKDNAAKSVWEKIKNYFAQTFSKFSGTKVE